MKPCEVTWCCMLAAPRSKYCTVHRLNPMLHPAEKSSDDHPAACNCKGTGDCSECDGSGEVECECQCGDVHETQCDHCDGSGECNDHEPTKKKRQYLPSPPLPLKSVSA